MENWGNEWKKKFWLKPISYNPFFLFIKTEIEGFKWRIMNSSGLQPGEKKKGKNRPRESVFWMIPTSRTK